MNGPERRGRGRHRVDHLQQRTLHGHHRALEVKYASVYRDPIAATRLDYLQVIVFQQVLSARRLIKNMMGSGVELIDG